MKLILMYVYYDKQGDIKAISPEEDGTHAKSFNHVLLPLAEVEPFILGKKNPFEYMIKKTRRLTGDTVKLIKKYTNLTLTRSMDNYLTQVKTTTDSEPIVKIVVNTFHKKIAIILNPTYKEMYENGTEDEKEKIDEFIKAGVSSIHITEENNPYHLYTSVSFLPKELFDKLRLDFTYNEGLDLTSSSAYTKRLVASYQYILKDYKNAI